MKSKYLLLVAISGALITLDQLTKMIIHTGYRLGESTVVIPGFFNITYVRNYGAAFGFLAEVNPAFREIFFLSIPPIALLIILRVLKGVPDEDRIQVLSLSMIFGGAIGNYIDRLRFRYVIDFL
ncbi:MAG TPA: signal peptidase II, partial [Bdellovibrionales bacterium]|nr:signal peptidase II [Bdellovibrionales bacterium]